MTLGPESFEIRPMMPADLDKVLVLERRCFADPWPRESFEIESSGDQGVHWSMVALRGQRLAGYVIAWYVLDKAHLANLAVSPMYRHLGLGRQLVELALEEARTRGARGMDLEVRPTNEAATALYSKMGFRLAGKRKGYYRGTPGCEDALVMTFDLSGSSD
ncbi:MAG: ribosomal protein S18-alanine N-acetyltransferase [Candidatus Eisenbacteria sp.]|nr:ribosomal protein S18-alanine N-acetyltransferase [Candidatus Eisenbacteria bacterium]